MSDHEQKIKIVLPEGSNVSGNRSRLPKGPMPAPTRTFLGGLLLGSVGLKLLGSRDAKKLYAHLVAGGMKVKDRLDQSVEGVRASYDDVMADARKIYEDDRREDKQREYADLSGEGSATEEVRNSPDFVDERPALTNGAAPKEEKAAKDDTTPQ